MHINPGSLISTGNESNDNALAKVLKLGLDSIGTLFHFTSEQAAKSIVLSQSFWASFIRSTSDPLEFALPLTACRNWLCDTSRWPYSKFPTEFFLHFNEIASGDHHEIRPYFISATKDRNVVNLNTIYGNSLVVLRRQETVPNQNSGLMAVTVQYASDVEALVAEKLEEWASLMFGAGASTALTRENLHLFMLAAYLISLSVKQNAYESEQEVRLIYLTSRHDHDGPFHMRRRLKHRNSKFERRLEYITLLMNRMGFDLELG